jgi:hypothetical protein
MKNCRYEGVEFMGGCACEWMRRKHESLTHTYTILVLPLPTAFIRVVEIHSFRKSNICVADVFLRQRELHSLEIRVIYNEKQSFDRVNVINYIFDNISQ